MNAILGFTEILSGLEEDVQKRQYIDSVRTSGKSLLGLINDILDLSKVEAGKLELQNEPTDVKALIDELPPIFAQKIQEQGLDLIIEAEDLPIVMVDGLRLRQMLLNLTSNAIKFTDAGHVRVTVTSDSAEQGVRLTFVVEDTGIGIPPDQQNKIFGAFEQTAGQSTSQYGGTGLGLAISKRLAELMNGEITLRSEVGKGSTFTIELRDLTAVSREDLEGLDADAEIGRVTFDSSKILIVDDVENNRLLIKAYLTEYGLDILEAASGEEALVTCREQLPDLVLMDLRMDGMSGQQAAQELKRDEATSSIPIIAHTAAAMKDQEEAIVGIFDGYLVKPASKGDVIRQLMQHLPHTIGNEAALTVEGTSEAAWSADELTPEQRASLTELVAQLQAELPRCQELAQTQSIDEIEVFASQMQEWATSFAYPPLGDWGQRLATQASLFDIPSMAMTLGEFDALLTRLRSVST